MRLLDMQSAIKLPETKHHLHTQLTELYGIWLFNAIEFPCPHLNKCLESNKKSAASASHWLCACLQTRQDNHNQTSDCQAVRRESASGGEAPMEDNTNE